MSEPHRKLPIGAEVTPDGVHFRVWAPRHRKIEAIVVGDGPDAPVPAALELDAEEGCYFSGTCREAGAGSLYRYRIDGGDSFPDPASRFQPQGPHGPSRVVDPAFDWTDQEWRGVGREGHVIYELHLCTYTREGTWMSAMEQFPALLDLAATLVEIMPIADFPGRFGWGYDGVNHFAPTRLHGEPDDMRRFVDRAHALGLGVIPDVVYNHFGPEGNYLERFSAHYYGEAQNEGLYHTADASLWFVHAFGRYLEYTGDRATLRLILPQMREIVERHLAGTSFGIGVDPSDGLLRQGDEGYQLTWMDAKVGDWVVTPRRGKTVELNALWYNALRLVQGWSAEEGDEAHALRLGGFAEQTLRSFNRRFWYAEGGYLYDLVDGESGDDAALRPNQLFAVSLPFPVLDPEKWPQVLDTVRGRLLTPVGLRTLASGHPDYKATYSGDLRARDAGYHQGTVWPWLIRAFVDAWLRLYPEQLATARGFMEGLVDQLNRQCIGSISEIFDAEEPYAPRGCVAQAWSVAEMLRCWLKTEQ